MPTVLYLGSFQSAWSTENYIANAFTRLGQRVLRVEESRTHHADIVARVAAMKPDVFLFAKGRFAEANKGWPQDARAIASLIKALRPHGSKVVCWLFDLLAAEFSAERWAWAEQVAAACDLFATTDGYTAPRLPNAVVVRQGVPDDVDLAATWPVEYQGDVLFLGTPYRDRWQLVELLARRFGPRFACVRDCRCRELTRLVRSYRICLGPHYPHFAGYWSNRIYVVTGHGGLFAAPPIEGMLDEGWQPGVNYLPLPLDPDAIVESLDAYLQRDAGELRCIQRAGFQHAQANFSYDQRVAELVGHAASPPSS